MADILDLDIHQEDDMAIDEAAGGDEGVGADEVAQLKSRVKKRKGRGFNMDAAREAKTEIYEHLDLRGRGVDEVLDISAQRSVEGWILIATGIHEEAHEDDVQGKFAEYGEIKNLHLNLDRRTGFLKGYALVEYENFKEASAAKTALDGTDLLGAAIRVDWAFMKKPKRQSSRRRQ